MVKTKPGFEQIDIAILGGGPAGLQAALILSRTRKKIIVFDDPEPPRNAASHGAHGFLGLDGFLVTEFRKVAWKQIEKYHSAELRKEKIANVNKEEDGTFLITNDSKTSVKAKKVVLAVGYHDVYPDIPGFAECWADTIIPCVYCDGYENRDRVWGIVANSKTELEKLPKMAQNWTNKIKVFLFPNVEITTSYQNELSKLNIPVYSGIITKVNHTNSKVESVLFESGEKIEADTLLWMPSKRPSPLIKRLVENLGLELDEQGYVKTNKMQQTNVKGLFAAGDVQNPSSGILEAAYTGGNSASSIVLEWYG
jgi:thioredoxin reductase